MRKHAFTRKCLCEKDLKMPSRKRFENVSTKELLKMPLRKRFENVFTREL
jgi:hypothetical protein